MLPDSDFSRECGSLCRGLRREIDRTQDAVNKRHDRTAAARQDTGQWMLGIKRTRFSAKMTCSASNVSQDPWSEGNGQAHVCHRDGLAVCVIYEDDNVF